jgi:hypothetical protein
MHMHLNAHARWEHDEVQLAHILLLVPHYFVILDNAREHGVGEFADAHDE